MRSRFWGRMTDDAVWMRQLWAPPEPDPDPAPVPVAAEPPPTVVVEAPPRAPLRGAYARRARKAGSA